MNFIAIKFEFLKGLPLPHVSYYYKDRDVHNVNRRGLVDKWEVRERKCFCRCRQVKFWSGACQL